MTSRPVRQPALTGFKYFVLVVVVVTTSRPSHIWQVAGFKYFRLYALSETPKLHATTLRAANTNSFGTAPIRVEAPLPAEYASAADAAFVEGILRPGDMLFIPKSVWHYVRSLTTSVSVNYWFD